MREVKKHWWRWENEGTNWRIKGDAQMQVPLCNSVGYPKFANKKSAVTCKNCKRLLLGYQGEMKWLN